MEKVKKMYGAVAWLIPCRQRVCHVHTINKRPVNPLQCLQAAYLA